VAVRRREGDEAELDGGRAAGLAPGAVLVRPAGKKPLVRLTVTEVTGPNTAKARVASPRDGAVATIEPGDVFEVERWANLAPEPLRIFVADALPAAEIVRVAKDLAPLRTSAAIRWVEDPGAAPVTHVLEHVGGAWTVGGPDGTATRLSGPPTAAAVEQLLRGRGVKGAPAPCDARPCLFVRLPPSRELAASLPWGRSPTDAVVPAPAAAADYVLAGRVGPAGPEYALLHTGGAGEGGFTSPEGGICAPGMPLPLRTGWTPAARAAASKLDDDAMKIARVRAWLTVTAPAPARPFGYRLEIRAGGKPVGPQGVAANAQLELWLVAEAERLARTERRFPYVLAIDCKGAIDLAYPFAREPDAFPPEDADARKVPAFKLGETIELDGTRGPYTFVLVTTVEQLPNPSLLTQPGVTRGDPGALTDFLSSLGGTTRGINRPVSDWSIDRIDVVAR
jgi:hypothetical protein